MSNRILQVAMPSPVPKTFDYIWLADQGTIQKGMRVLAPFGKRQLCGMILETVNSSTVDAAKLKTITSVLDTAPLWDEKLLQLVLWLSDYYHYRSVKPS